MSILVLILALNSFYIDSDIKSNYPISSENCELKATAETSQVGNEFLVEISVENNTNDVQYFFFNEDRNLINLDTKDNEMKISEKGEYFCIVFQDDKCHIKIDFEL